MTDNRPDLKGLGVPALHDIHAAAVRDVEDAKRWLITVNDEINERFADTIKAALAAQGKDSGTVTQVLDGGFEIKGEVGKKVDWDSDKLLATAMTIPFDQAKQIFKFAVSVPEKIYNGLKAANPALGAAVDGARTTTFSAPKVTLRKDD